MPVDLTELRVQVERAVTVGDSAIALLNGIQGKIEAAVAADNLADNSATAQLAVSLKGELDNLATAVETNTTPSQG